MDNEAFQSTQTVFHCADPEQMMQAVDHSLLQLVMGQVIVASKIIKEHPDDPQDLLELLMQGQTVVLDQEEFFELG